MFRSKVDNFIDKKHWDMITHMPWFQRRFIDTAIEGKKWIIIPHTKQWMWLLTHATIADFVRKQWTHDWIKLFNMVGFTESFSAFSYTMSWWRIDYVCALHIQINTHAHKQVLSKIPIIIFVLCLVIIADLSAGVFITLKHKSGLFTRRMLTHLLARMRVSPGWR